MCQVTGRLSNYQPRVCKVLKQSATIVELFSDSACHLLYIYKEIFPNLK